MKYLGLLACLFSSSVSASPAQEAHRRMMNEGLTQEQKDIAAANRVSPDFHVCTEQAEEDAMVALRVYEKCTNMATIAQANASKEPGNTFLAQVRDAAMFECNEAGLYSVWITNFARDMRENCRIRDERDRMEAIIAQMQAETNAELDVHLEILRAICQHLGVALPEIRRH